MNIKKHLILLAVLVFFSCNDGSEKFNKTLWQMQSDKPSSYRESMIKDVMENNLLVGLPYQQIIQQLGEPDSKETYKESFTLTYDISKQENSNQEPVRVKSLTIIFSDDSLIKDFKVEEWKFK